MLSRFPTNLWAASPKKGVWTWLLRLVHLFVSCLTLSFPKKIWSLLWQGLILPFISYLSFFFYSKSSESFQILQDSFSWLIQWGSQASFSWKHLGVCLTIMEILCGETSNLRWLRRRLPSLQKDLKMSSWIICFLISPDCPLSQWKQI